MSEPCKWHVYALTEASGARRYIGMSRNPKQRLVSHLSKGASDSVCEWVKSIGYQPGLEILESLGSESEARSAERAWIVRLRGAGLNLLNKQEGTSIMALSTVVPRSVDGLPERLRLLRQANNLTQHQLAYVSGVDHPAINRIENGKKLNIAPKTAVALADSLGCSLDYLLTGKEFVSRTRSVA